MAYGLDDTELVSEHQGLPIRNKPKRTVGRSGVGVQRTAVRVLCPSSLTSPQRLHGKGRDAEAGPSSPQTYRANLVSGW